MPKSKNIAEKEEDPIEIEIEIDFDDLEENVELKAAKEPVDADEPVAEEPVDADEPVAEEPVGADEPVAEEPDGAEEPVDDEEAVAEEPDGAGEPLDDIAAAIAASIGELAPESSAEPNSSEENLSSPVAPRLTAPSTIKSADKLNFRLVGIKTWKVKVKIGLVYDFSDIKTLQKYIKDGRVTNEDTISHNGKDWTTIGDIPDLEDHFIRVYLEAEKDSPTPTGASRLMAGSNGEESSLTSEIMAQITQESLNAVETGQPVGPDFIDPFAELKKKQRTRIKQRDGIRSMHKEAEKTDSNTKIKKNVLIFLLAAVAIYLIVPHLKPETTTSGGAEGGAVETVATNAQDDVQASSSRAEELERALNDRLLEIQAEADSESVEPVEEVRIYVQPDTPPQQPAGTPTTQEAQRPPEAVAPQLVSRVTPANRARQAYLNQNWSVAQEAYSQAFNSTRDPQMILGLGKSLYRLGDHRGAEQRLLAADQAGAMDQEGLRFLAQIYIDRGDPMGANTYQQRLR